MKAVNYYLIVEKIKESKTVGGLLITDDLDEDNRYTKAKVVSVGNLVEGIKENDIIYYDNQAGHSINYKDILYYVIKVGDVVLID
jgi:co-chaperonin GroES (HSP10)|tara:strand:- start:510 stop:764 length:255 start_codon:yes stop_codon:yes gene_type:complete